VPATDNHLFLLNRLWWVVPLANNKCIFCLLWWRVVIITADRLVPHNSTEVSRTACSGQAGVNTIELLTGFVQGTIIIYQTLSPVAAVDTVSHRTRWAFTAIAVPLKDTHGTCSTWIRYAGIRLLHALLLRAYVPVLTVWIYGALRTTASYCVWLRDKTINTFTYGVTIRIWGAGGSWATWRWITGIRFLNASLTFAYKTIFAIGVDRTFGSTSSYCVRLWNKPRLASADWISILVSSACGSWSTRARVARVSD